MNRACSFTPRMRAELGRRGLIKLDRAVDRTDALAMASRLWEELERRHGVTPQQPETWTAARPSGFGSLARRQAFASMASPVVTDVIDALLGVGSWQPPAHWGVPLVTFPQAFPHTGAAWQLPHQHWHSDWPVDPAGAPVARLFVLLSELRPRGGATLVVTGSHVLLQRTAAAQARVLRSAEARKRLCAAHPWFAELCSANAAADRVERFMTEGAEIDGVEVRVVELTGEPGDVYFMHPSILHAPSQNARGTPRMAVTQAIVGNGSVRAD